MRSVKPEMDFASAPHTGSYSSETVTNAHTEEPVFLLLATDWATPNTCRVILQPVTETDDP